MSKVSSDDPDLVWYRRGTQQLRLSDAIDSATGAAMTVGFARYAAGTQLVYRTEEASEVVYTSYPHGLEVT